MKFGILGSGSWGTAIVKILTDNGHDVHWWNRSQQAIDYIKSRGHNPQYLTSAKLDTGKISLTTSAPSVVNASEVIVIVVPSAYLTDALAGLDKNIFEGKKIVSAVKGIMPEHNILLNDFLKENFNVKLENYFALLGPCHAEEVAAERLSYLTLTGIDEAYSIKLSEEFRALYINTVVNQDIYGVQYAAVLKNIYAVGAGIAHGLDYGDNFQSVLIANSANEMAVFLRKAGIINAEVGFPDHPKDIHDTRHNYAASVYLGDLLVTCYSLHSRNRAFGNMIGKGYSVNAAKLEMNMVAEGYNASRCMYIINQTVQAEMPIATTVHNILWNGLNAEEGFKYIESVLV